MFTKQLYLSLLALLLVVAPCLGMLLPDAAIYFDPDTITMDHHPRIVLNDLSVKNYYVWAASWTPVVDVDILPILKGGIYPPGYAYTQNDYELTPNIDYTADLTGGTLTCTFYAPGLYHVRVVRANGQSTTYAVFAETGLLEKDKSEKTSKSTRIPLPEGDLFVAENSDETVDNAAKILENGGRQVERANDRDDVVEAIKKKSQQLGRKIHAEIVGHGTNGNVSTGAGKQNIPGKQIDLSSVEKFQKDIDGYVNHITFQACNVGKGEDGKKFLKILSDSIGKAGAYDSSLIVVNQSYFALPVGGTWVEENKLDKAAHNFDPTTADTPVATALTWNHGSEANFYEVYLSTSQTAVAARHMSAFAGVTMNNFYPLEFLELGQTYYYAVDSHGGSEPYRSDVWKFTVQQAVTVDDFNYATVADLHNVWMPINEAQSGPIGDFRTVNENAALVVFSNFLGNYSGIKNLFPGPQNWLLGGGENLNLWLKALEVRDLDMVFVELADASHNVATYHVPAMELIMAGEQGFNLRIPFAAISYIDLANVTSLSIFVDTSMQLCEPGMCGGSIIVDDIRITGAQCFPLEADINNDGIVNLADLGTMAAEWLRTGCQ